MTKTKAVAIVLAVVLLVTALWMLRAYAPFRRGPSGSIAGQIRNEDSAPAADLSISARKEGKAGTPEVSGAIRVTRTDDAGKFLLEDVPAGRYRVWAGSPLTQTDFSDAVVVTADQTTENINITIRRTSGARLRGKVLGAPPGTPPGLLYVALSGPTDGPMLDTPLRPDGTFEFPHPGPGRISLGVAALQAHLNLDVGREDVENLELAAPLMTLMGQVSVAGAARLPIRPEPKGAGNRPETRASEGTPRLQPFGLTTVGIRLEARGSDGTAKTNQFVRSDGVFGFPALTAGEYSFRVASIPAGYELKSIVSGNVDLMREPLRISSDKPPHFVEVTLSSTAPAAVTRDTGTLVVSQSGRGPLYFEGSIPFFLVKSGAFREERPLGGEWCMTPQGRMSGYGPICQLTGAMLGDSDAIQLPPGDYDLRGYVRPCDGNCGILDRSQDECGAEITIKAGQTLFAERRQHGHACTLAISPVPFR